MSYLFYCTQNQMCVPQYKVSITLHGPLICGRSVLDFFFEIFRIYWYFRFYYWYCFRKYQTLGKEFNDKKKKIKEFYNFFLKFFCCSTLGIFEVLEEFWLRPRGVIKSILWGIGVWKKVQDLREHFNYGESWSAANFMYYGNTGGVQDFWKLVYWGGVKSSKFWLSKSIFFVKNHWNFSHFFSLKAYFLLLSFFDSFYVLLKWCLIFQASPLTQI